MTELIGYLASIVVSVSFFFKGIILLRIVNIIGSTIFIIYALLIRAYPVACLNLFAIIFNLINLIRGRSKK
jgi:hypothetical protein